MRYYGNVQSVEKDIVLYYIEIIIWIQLSQNAPVVLRLFAPAGTIAEFEQIITNSDGSFSYRMLYWPSSSTKFPYGTYTVEALTNTGESQKIDIKFAASTEPVTMNGKRHRQQAMSTFFMFPSFWSAFL